MSLPISTDIKNDIDTLVAGHHDLNQVYQTLQANYLFRVNEISYLGGPSLTIPSWRCNIVHNEIDISVPLGDRGIESFAHELLHVKLDSDGFTDSKDLVRWLASLHEPIPFLFAEQNLVAHINNSLAHFKMYDKFLSLGFASEKFTIDFNSSPVQTAYMDMIEADFYNIGLPNDAIGVFIGQFIGCRYCINPIFTEDVDNALLKLKAKNEDLFWLCEEFLTEWSTMKIKDNLALITKFAYGVREWYNTNRALFNIGI